MATSINVNKQSVTELLQTGKKQQFVIPEYQRPYAWTVDQIDQLFIDIWGFATSIGGVDGDATYFLGTIVAYENNDKQEIIDGQQRITSLFLLLRAIYTKLTSSEDKNNEKAQNFIKKIEPTIWKEDKLTGKVDYSNILIESKVVDNEGNEVLRNILETGKTDEKAKDKYSVNYRRFQELYEEKCAGAPFEIYNFIYALLNQCILMPITADTQDTALTIFSTLNNRGLPLSDADIFKAKIYDHLSGEEKDTFIKEWKSLDKDATEANESIQQLFYYYMFYLRAKEGIFDSTTPGIRKYYMEKNGERLFDKSLLENLRIVLNVWKVINTNQDIPEETWDNNKQIRKALDTLTAYPNEYWKYPIIIYYICHRDKPDFEQTYLLFIRKLTSELLTYFLLYPTVNAVKVDILKINIQIFKTQYPEVSFKKTIDKQRLVTMMHTPQRIIVRMLLLIYAYKSQDDLLPDNWQIEHILPRKWQDTFFDNTPDEEIEEMIEHIGNKTAFERKLNIVASNGYFGKKQEEYAKSEIKITQQLTQVSQPDWKLENIRKRDELITHEVLNLFDSWTDEYQKAAKAETFKEPGLTTEELAVLEKLKEKGYEITK